jgi:hypothetical protein
MNPAERRTADASSLRSSPGSKSSATTHSSTAGSHFSAHSNRGSADSSHDITREVALKVIPKKKVKGNEASVWSEMEVLKGLDHPNIVRLSPLNPDALSSILCCRSNSTNGSSHDQSTISLSSSQLGESYSIASASADGSLRMMRSRSFGTSYHSTTMGQRAISVIKVYIVWRKVLARS